MKRIVWLFLILALLCGCGSEPTFETIGDDLQLPAMQQQKKIVLDIPEDAVTIHGDSGTIYICKDYTVTVEVLSAGSIGATMESITGFSQDELTVLETSASNITRYECAWAAAGEEGDVVGNAAVLDDGIWHYCVTVEYRAADASKLQPVWVQILKSVKLI